MSSVFARVLDRHDLFEDFTDKQINTFMDNDYYVNKIGFAKTEKAVFDVIKEYKLQLFLQGKKYGYK